MRQHRACSPRQRSSYAGGRRELAVRSVACLDAALVYSPGVGVRVLGTGVLIRLASDDEVQAVERARYGRDLELVPSRSYRGGGLYGPVAKNEVLVVSQAFVEFADGANEERWGSYEHHGHRLSVVRDATLELLLLAEETGGEDLVEDLLSDMRIAELGVSRWELMSAPRRIELEPELEARLAPLRRG